jgi:hypothetical protein
MRSYCLYSRDLHFVHRHQYGLLNCPNFLKNSIFIFYCSAVLHSLLFWAVLIIEFRYYIDRNNLLHRKKRFTSFPSPAGMSLTKLPLGRNNSVMTSLLPPRESLVVTSWLGTGNSRTFFLRCTDVVTGLVDR